MNKCLKNDFISFTIKDETLYINIESNSNPTETDFNQLLEWWGVIFKDYMNYPFCMIINIEKITMLSMSYLIRWVQIFKKYNSYIEKNVIATSVICSSSIAKNMLDAFFIFYTPIKPTKIFKNNENYTEYIVEEYNKYKNLRK